MRAIVDSIKGSSVKCLIENGDILTVKKKFLPDGIVEGDVLKVSMELDKTETKKQRELIKSYKS